MAGRINKHSPGCFCCGGEEVPEDPCSPGTPLTPYIWFDHDLNGSYEDGPHLMVHDAAAGHWTYELVKTHTYGFIGSSTIGNASCNAVISATIGLFYAFKHRDIAAGNSRWWYREVWWACCRATFTPWIQQNNLTPPAWVNTGTGSAPDPGTPIVDCPSTPGTPGWNGGATESATEACSDGKNRLFVGSGLDYHPGVLITRTTSSAGP